MTYSILLYNTFSLSHVKQGLDVLSLNELPKVAISYTLKWWGRRHAMARKYAARLPQGMREQAWLWAKMVGTKYMCGTCARMRYGIWLRQLEDATSIQMENGWGVAQEWRVPKHHGREQLPRSWPGLPRRLWIDTGSYVTRGPHDLLNMNKAKMWALFLYA